MSEHNFLSGNTQRSDIDQKNVYIMVSASNLCTRHLVESNVKMTANNFPNITISHQKKFFKNCEKRRAVV